MHRFLTIGLIFGCCSVANAQEAAATPFTVTTIAYLGDTRTEAMDVYQPTPRPSDDGEKSPALRPAILYIHGGGWGAGSRKGARETTIASALARRGYVVFSIDYHLTKYEGALFSSKKLEPGWPQNIYDCKSALRYIRTHAEQHQVDPDAVGVMGCSAGGHLALLTALSASSAELNQGGLYQGVPCDVRCVISFYGIPDVRVWGGGSFIGVGRLENPDVWALASPVTHVDSDSPPVMLVHGDRDDIVDVSMSTNFAEQLEQQGVPHELIVIEGAKHGFAFEVLDRDLEPSVLAFLEQHLGAPPE